MSADGRTGSRVVYNFPLVQFFIFFTLMPIFYLASYPYGLKRNRETSVDGQPLVRKRARLESEPWFCHTLVDDNQAEVADRIKNGHGDWCKISPTARHGVFVHGLIRSPTVMSSNMIIIVISYSSYVYLLLYHDCSHNYRDNFCH